MATTDNPIPASQSTVATRKLCPEDIEPSALIPLVRLRMQEVTIKFTGAGQLHAVHHDLNCVPMLVLAIEQTTGTPSAIFAEARPRSSDYVYLKCSSAKATCRVLIGG